MRLIIFDEGDRARLRFEATTADIKTPTTSGRDLEFVEIVRERLVASAFRQQVDVDPHRCVLEERTPNVPFGFGIGTEIGWIESAEAPVEGVCKPASKHHDRSLIRIEVSKKVLDGSAEDVNVALAEAMMDAVNREHPPALHDVVERVLLMEEKVGLHGSRNEPAMGLEVLSPC